MGQNVFVTGATGVLGRRLVPRLVEAGHRVTAVARTAEKAAALRAAGARDYDSTDDPVGAAEAAALGVTNAGGIGIVLRFALFMAADSAHTTGTYSAAQRGQFTLPGDLDGYTSFIHMDDAATAVVAALSIPAGTYNVAEPDPVRRSAHRDALCAAVGGSQLDPVPAPAAAARLARSHRISSRHLSDVSSWTPTVCCVDQWKELG